MDHWTKWHPWNSLQISMQNSSDAQGQASKTTNKCLPPAIDACLRPLICHWIWCQKRSQFLDLKLAPTLSQKWTPYCFFNRGTKIGLISGPKLAPISGSKNGPHFWEKNWSTGRVFAHFCCQSVITYQCARLHGPDLSEGLHIASGESQCTRGSTGAGSS